MFGTCNSLEIHYVVELVMGDLQAFELNYTSFKNAGKTQDKSAIAMLRKIEWAIRRIGEHNVISDAHFERIQPQLNEVLAQMRPAAEAGSVGPTPTRAPKPTLRPGTSTSNEWIHSCPSCHEDLTCNRPMATVKKGNKRLRLTSVSTLQYMYMS